MGDCLHVLINLLKRNHSNQSIFLESGHVQRVLPFFEFLEHDTSTLGTSGTGTLGGTSGNSLEGPGPGPGVGTGGKAWSAQKTRNVLLMLHLLRALVAPNNTPALVRSAQLALLQNGSHSIYYFLLHFLFAFPIVTLLVTRVTMLCYLSFCYPACYLPFCYHMLPH